MLEHIEKCWKMFENVGTCLKMLDYVGKGWKIMENDGTC